MAYVTDIRIAGTPLSKRFTDLRANFAQRAEQRRMYRETYNELDALSDRDLNDLGIARSKIATIAREAAYK